MGAVPTPATQIAGTAVAAATINSQGNLATYLAGRIESGGSRRALFVGRLTVAQTLTTGTTPVGLNLDSEDVDYDNGHSTVTNTSRYTVQTAGWYWVFGDATFAANATANRAVVLRVNSANLLNGGGSIVPAATGGVRITQTPAGSLVGPLAVGDFIELGAWQESGGNLQVVAARLSVQLASQ